MWGAQYIRFQDSAMGMMSSHFAMLLAAQHPSLVILLPPTRIHWPSFKAEVCCLLLTRFPLPLLPLPPSPPLTTRWLLLLLFLAVLVRPCASMCVLVHACESLWKLVHAGACLWLLEFYSSGSNLSATHLPLIPGPSSFLVQVCVCLCLSVFARARLCLCLCLRLRLCRRLRLCLRLCTGSHVSMRVAGIEEHLVSKLVRDGGQRGGAHMGLERCPPPSPPSSYRTRRGGGNGRGRQANAREGRGGRVGQAHTFGMCPRPLGNAC